MNGGGGIKTSIIIPCRNEENFIGKCLDSIIAQDYPKEEMEVLVINGASEDKTKEIVGNYSRKYPFIKLLENPQRFTPFGLNLGIKNAKGEIIIRMDAHAGYEKDYVSKCVKYLKESGADNVGGIIKTLPSKNTLTAKAIALCLSSFFGAGGSHFRTGTEKPRWVDTVFCGCYRKEVFEKIGYYNENLIRSQDIELNRRLLKGGGKILLVPEIKAYYYPQDSLSKFLKHNFIDGLWTIFPFKFGIRIFSWRHLLPLMFVSVLLFSLSLSFFFRIFFILFFFILTSYFIINLFFSFQIAKKEKNLKLFFILPLVFFSRHFAYGFGSLSALIKIL